MKAITAIGLFLVLLAVGALEVSAGGEGGLVEDQIFQSRPQPDREMEVGHIGPTGIIGRFYRKGVLQGIMLQIRTNGASGIPPPLFPKAVPCRRKTRCAG